MGYLVVGQLVIEVFGLKILEVNRKKEYVKVVPETFDDFWHLYNIIYRSDRVYARTTREIKTDKKYARSSRGERVPVFLGVNVENVSWDKFLGRLRVHGTVCEATEKVPAGAHHTLNITLNTPLTVVKKEWAKHHLDRLKRASATSEKSILIVSIDDEGYAIATTAQYGIEEKVEERIKLPGKHEAEKRSAALNEYFRKVVDSMWQVWDSARSPIAVIGLGYVKNDFAKFMENEGGDMAKSVVDVKSVNNGGVAGIYEAFRSGVLLKTMSRMRMVEETEIVEEFLRRLGKGEANVAYGFEEVKKAADMGAVEKLVLADSALRDSSDEQRLRLEELMKNVEDKKGMVMVVSTEHEAGKKLSALNGIVGLLRFQLPTVFS
jgi:protein pelota